MKQIYYILALVMVATAFQSCKSTQRSSSEKNPENSRVMILLHAGSCFGKCKVYELSILESGKAELNAIKNIKQLGRRTLDIPKERMDALSELLENNKFESFESSYLSGAKDLQVFEITYRGKYVKFQKMKAPKELLEILKFIQSLLEEELQ